MKISTVITALLCMMGFAGATDASVQMGVEQASSDFIVLTDANFQEGIASGKVVVDFYASWCGACKHFMPIFDATAAEHKGAIRFAKANADTAKASMGRYGIKAYPTVILFENGKEVKRFTGSKDKVVFEQFLGVRAQAAEPAPTHKKVEKRSAKPARAPVRSKSRSHRGRR